MADLTCATCVFWTEEEEDKVTDLRSVPNFKRCTAVKFVAFHDDEDTVCQVERAIVIDGEDYAAQLLTREDFGCVLHYKNRAMMGPSAR